MRVWSAAPAYESMMKFGNFFQPMKSQNFQLLICPVISPKKCKYLVEISSHRFTLLQKDLKSHLNTESEDMTNNKNKYNSHQYPCWLFFSILKLFFLANFKSSVDFSVKKGIIYHICMTFKTMQRGAFCHFPFLWVNYYGSNESNRKETGKTHLCAMQFNRTTK